MPRETASTPDCDKVKSGPGHSRTVRLWSNIRFYQECTAYVKGTHVEFRRISALPASLHFRD